MRKCVFIAALFIAVNAQAQWVTMNKGVSVSLNGICMLDSKEGWVVGDDGTVYHLTAGGFQWEPESGLPGSEDFNDVCFVSSAAGWCVGTSGSVSDGRVYKRNTEGAWTELSPPSTQELLALCCISGSTESSHRVWITGLSRTILHSSNSGSVLNKQTSLAGSAYRDVTFVNQSRGWIVGNAGVIVRTANGGSVWSPELPSGTPAWLFGVYFADQDHGWAVGTVGTIVATSDGGSSWSPQTCPLTSRLNAVTGIDTLNLIAVGDDGSVVRTSDGGGKWVEEKGLAGDLHDVAMMDTMNYWVVGADGANFYSMGSVEFTGSVPDTMWAGDTYDIRFFARFIDRVDLSFKSRSGANWDTFAVDYPVTDTPYPWPVPELNSEEARLRITSAVPGRDLSDEMTFPVFVKDQDPPVISNVDFPNVPLKRTNIKVSATIEDEQGVLATLWFRRGGSEVYNDTPMTATAEDTTRFEGVIEGGAVTVHGLEYYIEAVDTSEYENRSFYPGELDPDYIKVYTENEGFPFTVSQPGSEIYSMISIPLDLSNNQISQVLEPEDVLGPYDRTKWRLFRWSPAANEGLGQYREYGDMLSETAFEPGRAFWLVESTTPGLKTGRGHSVPSADGRIDIEHIGWHQVANPFAYDVPVESIDLDPSIDGFYHWDPDADAYNRLDGSDASEVLEPYDGYFIRSDAADLSITIPPIDAEAVGRPAKQAQRSLDWQIVLHVRSEGARESRLLFGQSSHADRHFDRLDMPDVPPPYHRRLNTYIPHPDWPTFKGNYRADVRCPDDKGLSWDFKIESEVDGLIEMAFDLDAEIPGQARVILIDGDTGLSHDLRVDSHIRYLGTDRGGVASFRLIVGPQEFVNEQSGLLLPSRFKLCQNYPNPFSASTSIRYALPGAGELALKIFDVRGEEVAVLIEDEPREAGYHVEVWDGRDRYGRDVSSGVYFYQLRVGTSLHTRKMLLIK
jgi:photosystem II stability/assembly factor-like uncharacterized protein